eukprot:jgi/Ulvmu1/911/UM101_0020.1
MQAETHFASTPPPVWCAEVAQAIAQQRSMPGLENRQHQFVRYEGRTEAERCDAGWRSAVSPAAAARRAQPPVRPTLGPSLHSADPKPLMAESGAAPLADPTTVQLRIISAPAHFCLPQKNDRQFKPAFHVQVRVQHDPTRSLQLPVRVKAFAVTHEEREALHEWLPPELRAAPPPILGTIPVQAGLPGMDLKGPTVLSHTFRSYIALPPPCEGGYGGADGADGRGLPLFPTRVIAEESANTSRVLADADCMMPRDDDPNLAAPVGSSADIGTCTARFEFKGLEFARPTRMNPVYLVFACLIGGRDLLYTVYDVPSISICRADQRTKALSRLGLPASVYAEVTEMQEGSTRPHRPLRRRVRRLQPPADATVAAATAAAAADAAAAAAAAGATAPTAAPMSDAAEAAEEAGAAGESLGECRGMEDIWADVAEGCNGLNAHSSNASVPAAPHSGHHHGHYREQAPSADHPCGGPSEEDRPGAESAACAPPPPPPSPSPSPSPVQGAASVDEVLKHFLQSNDKLTAVPLARWGTEGQGRYEPDAITGMNLGSLRLPSDLPPLEHVLSDTPALDARHVPPLPGCSAADVLRDGRLLALPSLQSNPTLSLSFSRFMATLDDDMRAMAGTGMGAAVPQEPHVATSDSGPAHTAQTPHAARGASNTGGRAGVASDGTPPPLAANIPVATSPRPQCTVPINNLSAHALALRNGDAAGAPEQRAQHAQHAAHDGGSAQHIAPVRVIGVDQAETDQLQLLLSEKSGSLAPLQPPTPPTPSPSPSNGCHAAYPAAPSMADDAQYLCSGPLVGPELQPQGTQWRAQTSAGAPDRRLPRWPSNDDRSAAWMSPRSPVTVTTTPRQPAAAAGGQSPQRPTTPSAVLPLSAAAAPPSLPRRMSADEVSMSAPEERGDSVSQAEVHAWINKVYIASGLTRALTCLDYQALLSLAGFPALAGLDSSSRIPHGQFRAFRQYLTAAMELLRAMPELWNCTDTAIVCGFDMDGRAAEAALAPQPVGTFLCRLCMRQPGCLLLSCKVDPRTASVDESRVMHVAISLADLRRTDPAHLIRSLPYASHVLDARTGYRIDKRVLLPGRQISITLAFGMLAVQAAVSDSSAGPRGASLKRPLDELAVQAAESALRSVQQDAAKRRRPADGADATGDAPLRGARPPRMPAGPQAAAAAARGGFSGDPMVSRGSVSEFTRWPAASTLSGPAM